MEAVLGTSAMPSFLGEGGERAAIHPGLECAPASAWKRGKAVVIASIRKTSLSYLGVTGYTCLPCLRNWVSG